MDLPKLTFATAIKGLRKRRSDFRGRRGDFSGLPGPDAPKPFSESAVDRIVSNAMSAIANRAPNEHPDDPIVLFGLQQHELRVSRAAMERLNLTLSGPNRSNGPLQFRTEHVRDPDKAEALYRLLEDCILNNIEMTIRSALPWGGPALWGDWVVTVVVPDIDNEG